MMKAAIISLGSTSSKWTAKAMGKYFDRVDDLDIRNLEVEIGTGKLEVLYNGKKLEKYDCIYPKGSFRYQSLLRSITAALNKDSYLPYTPESFVVGHDKLLTQLDLQKNNIPMPKAYVASTEEQAKKILERVNYPIIIKFPKGTQGKGVMYATGYATAVTLLDALATLKQPFIIQEYVETGGVDIRAIVTGDKVVAAMKRKAPKREKRANIHMGGVGEKIELDSMAKKIAIKSAKVIGAEICAVDILESATGPQVIEVNLSPGLQGITEATKIDVADEIAKYLYKKTKERVEGHKKVSAKEILEELEKVREIITNLHFRGERILLPKAVTRISRIKEDDEVIIDIEKGKFTVTKSEIGGKE